jgi:hypothetical protein
VRASLDSGFQRLERTTFRYVTVELYAK